MQAYFIGLQGVENSGLAALKSAVDKQDLKMFDTAYRQTITECYACHKASEKPFLRPQIPQTPATRIINLRPTAN